MTSNLFLSEILFMIITMIALAVFWQLYKSKNGMLRKIMIAYFLIEAFIYTASALYFWAIDQRHTNLPIEVFRLIILSPKALVMLWLFSWLSTKNNNTP